MPYFDTNDYYFSGHLCSSSNYLIMFYYIDNKWGLWLTVWQWCYNWYVMSVCKTHYCIDYPPSVALAFLGIRWCEIVSYYIDVKIFGFRSETRANVWFKNCPKCGWSN